MRTITSILPDSVKTFSQCLRDIVKSSLYYGKGRFCPICGKSSRQFRKFGLKSRKDAECAHCGSLERHRLFWLYISNRTDIFNGAPKKTLHVAPESCLETRFKQQLGEGYLTADLLSPQAMIQMDVTSIDFPDEYFDIIYCSHVLEHVQDDKTAMREFFRTLKNDGWAILLVPITEEKTFEDPSIVDPMERLKRFGQEDHFRRYGRDYIDRLCEAGFSVEVIQVSDMVDSGDAVRMGLTEASGEIHYCVKKTDL